MGLFDWFQRKSVSAQDAFLQPLRLLLQHSSEGITDPYSQSIYFYAAVRKIALQFEGTAWRIEGRTSKKPVPDTDRLAALFARPNPLMSGADFRLLCVLYWTIYGGVQILKLGPQGSRVTDERDVPWYLFPVPVTGWERIKPNPTDILSFGGWKWGSNTFKPYEVISLVEHDPSMLSLALPITRPLRLTFERTFSADQYYSTLFKNGAIPSGILSTDQPLGPEQAREILDAFEARHKGMANSGRPAIVHSGLKYQTTAMDLKSVNLPEDRKAALEEVCMATGVPKTVLGITEDANRATAREQMAIFLEQTVIPRMQSMERAFDEQFFQPAAPAYRGRFVVEDIPALKRTDSELATTAQQLKTLGVPGAQIKAHLGLSYDIPDPVLPAVEATPAAGDASSAGATVAEVTYNGAQVTSAVDILRGVTDGTIAPEAAVLMLINFLRLPPEDARAMVAAQETAEPPPPPAPPAPPAEPKPEKPEAPAKSITVVSAAEALRRSHAILSQAKSARASRLEQLRQQIVAATFDPTERALLPALQAHWVKLRGVQLRRLNQFLRDGMVDAKSLDASQWFHVAKGAEVVPSPEQVGQILFTSAEADASLYTRTAKPIEDAILLVADYMADELPNGLLKFDVTHPAITDATKARLAEMVRINETTQADIRTSILKTLDALAGASPTEIARQLREDVGGAFDRAYNRTLTIARTESGAVASDYRHAVIEVEGFQEHEWIPAGDELTREDHADFGAQGAIPIAQSFRASSGAEMLRPHEPGAPAEQIANCRCVEIAAGTLKSVSVPAGSIA